MKDSNSLVFVLKEVTSHKLPGGRGLVMLELVFVMGGPLV